MWFMKSIRLDEEDLKDEQGVDRAIAKIEKGAVDRRESGSNGSK